MKYLFAFIEALVIKAGHSRFILELIPDTGVLPIDLVYQAIESTHLLVVMVVHMFEIGGHLIDGEIRGRIMGGGA